MALLNGRNNDESQRGSTLLLLLLLLLVSSPSSSLRGADALAPAFQRLIPRRLATTFPNARRRPFAPSPNTAADGDVADGGSGGGGTNIGDFFNNAGVSGYRSDGYSRSLDRRKKIVPDGEEDEDGYDEVSIARGGQKRAMWKRVLYAPFQASKKAYKTVRDANKDPGTLILVRHGESEWNANKTFTGWADPDLSEQGVREMEHAARLLLEGGYDIDVVFTSRLTRAIRSSFILLKELNEIHIPVFKSWRLNERMYGALTGLSKVETAEQIGSDVVQKWRGSLHARPPALAVTDTYWPGKDRRHFDLSLDQIPRTESLNDCMERTAPVWDKKIMKELRAGRNVLVVAHANTMRGLVKIIDNIGDEEIQDVSIPTGIPIIYKFDKTAMTPVRHSGSSQSAQQEHMNGLFLEKPGLLTEALKREEEWTTRVPGYDSTMRRSTLSITPLERSLNKLTAERELGQWAGQFVDPNRVDEDDGTDGNNGRPVQYIESKSSSDDDEEEDDDEANPDHVAVGPILVEPQPVVTTAVTPCVTAVPSTAGEQNKDVAAPIRKDAVIVIIRHGKTEHNKLGLFTGWEDVPLAKEGVEEAKAAGRLLRTHGYEFDVVYTSWLSRAIDTAWNVMDELDCLWLPIIKSWRLNERMYGNLTGLSKRMVAQRHGEAQFKAWRRGFDVRPPRVSSFSPNYPGNDKRYRKYLRDVRYSVRESLIRTIEQGRPVLVRRLPKTESLKDCMDRTIPYFAYQIVPEAINQGKRVLISSSENAIRGLLMHLCEIPEEKICELEIPNGLPLIFDVKSKCVKLLDDGTGRDPLEVYNFGKASSYLFRPCVNENGEVEECDIMSSPPTKKASTVTVESSTFEVPSELVLK